MLACPLCVDPAFTNSSSIVRVRTRFARPPLAQFICQFLPDYSVEYEFEIDVPSRLFFEGIYPDDSFLFHCFGEDEFYVMFLLTNSHFSAHYYLLSKNGSWLGVDDIIRVPDQLCSSWPSA